MRSLGTQPSIVKVYLHTIASLSLDIWITAIDAKPFAGSLPIAAVA